MKSDANLKSWLKIALYVSIAWILLVCYSIFVKSAISSLFNVELSDLYIEIIIFLYGLAVISFLGGSLIPAIFFRKKSFIIQFAFSAAFGFILFLITGPFEANLETVKQMPTDIFLSYPIVALEYLSLPYVFIIFIDLYSNGNLSGFSWRHFGQLLKGTFLHPRRTFKEIIYRKSILFSFVSVILVCFAWVFWASGNFLTCSNFYFKKSLDPISWIALIIPGGLFLWLIMTGLFHVIAIRCGGRGCYSYIASMVGFVFLPTLMKIAIDLIFLIPYTRINPETFSELPLSLGPLEIRFYTIGNELTSTVFWLLDFFIPLFLWPVFLATFAIQISEKLTLLRAIATAVIAIIPLFLLLWWSIL